MRRTHFAVVDLALVVHEGPRGGALVPVLAQIAGARDGLAATAAAARLLAEVTGALMLLDHHIDGLLGVVEVELVVLCLLLLRTFLQLVIIVVQRMLGPVMVYVPPSDVIHGARTASPVKPVRPLTPEPRILGSNGGWRPPKDLLLQLHLLAMLLGPIGQLLLHQIQALEEGI